MKTHFFHSLCENIHLTLPLLLFLLCLWGVYPALSDEQMAVHFIDVGAGDATLVQSGTSKILVDAGPAGQNLTVEYLEKNGITDLDGIILTRKTTDRIGGMQHVLNKTTVRQFYEPGEASELPSYLRLKRELSNRSIPMQTLASGDAIPLGDEQQITVLGIINGTDGNTSEMMLAISDRVVKILLLPDAEPDPALRSVSAKIVRIPDEGSYDWVNLGVLRNLNPETAIISTDEHTMKNSPLETLLASSEGLPAKVYRTGYDGSVIIRTDGEKYSVQTKKESTGGSLSLISVIETRPPQ